jgi:hypothetical protein
MFYVEKEKDQAREVESFGLTDFDETWYDGHIHFDFD